MSGRTPEFAAELTRGWVRFYTRGLPNDLRSARRSELESDLWEHMQANRLDGRSPSMTASEIVGRLLAGIPADLSWRHEHRRLGRGAPAHSRSQNMLDSVKKHGIVAVAAALGVWLFAMAVLAASDGNLSTAGRVGWPFASAIAGLLTLVGLVGLRRGWPRSRELLTVGAVAGGLFSMWAIVPTVAAAGILVWLYAPRRLRRMPAEPA